MAGVPWAPRMGGSSPGPRRALLPALHPVAQSSEVGDAKPRHRSFPSRAHPACVPGICSVLTPAQHRHSPGFTPHCVFNAQGTVGTLWMLVEQASKFSSPGTKPSCTPPQLSLYGVSAFSLSPVPRPRSQSLSLLTLPGIYKMLEI